MLWLPALWSDAETENQTSPQTLHRQLVFVIEWNRLQSTIRAGLFVIL